MSHANTSKCSIFQTFYVILVFSERDNFSITSTDKYAALCLLSYQQHKLQKNRNTERENSGVVGGAKRERRLFIPAAAHRVAERVVQLAGSELDLDLTEVHGVCGQPAGYRTAGLVDHRYLGIDSPANQINFRRTNIKALPKRKSTGIFAATKLAITGPLAVAGPLSGSERLWIDLTCSNSAILVSACCSDSQ